jgi:hypothetical protein
MATPFLLSMQVPRLVSVSTESTGSAAADHCGIPIGESRAPLEISLHTAEDMATPAHFLQPWNGFHLNWTTISHLWGDLFPSQATLDNATNNAIAIMTNTPITVEGSSCGK